MNSPHIMTHGDAAMLGDSCQEYAAHQWRDGQVENVRTWVAEEVPVALVYNGISHAVMLASPRDLENFALGFSLSEMILHDRAELHDLEVVPRHAGIEVRMTIASARFNDLKQRRRNLTGRTGCGICGVESLEQAIRRPAPVEPGVTITARMLHAAFKKMNGLQHLQSKTGAAHAAGWATPDSGIAFVQEDIGRHNALDKLIGAVARQDIRLQSGFAIVTSRASYEMVQKAATVGISLLAAISAPTGLAIRLAEETGLTLIGFTRNHSHVVYANPRRLTK
ncbi:MAG: formate dehydrogenase accessory sulfurtransferase FdhD [Burkholderiales bacterium]